MMILQLFILLLLTLLLYGFIFFCCGGISETYPVSLGSATVTDISLAVRRGACPLWLEAPSLSVKELDILRRCYPWIFLRRRE